MKVLTESRIKRTNECSFVGKISNIEISPKEFSPEIAKEFPDLTGFVVVAWFKTEKRGRACASYLLAKNGHFILGAN